MSRKCEVHKLLPPQAQTHYKVFQQDNITFKLYIHVATQESPNSVQAAKQR